MKIHHSTVHKEGSQKKTYECDHCGDTFEEYPSRIERPGRNHFFCDKGCKDAWEKSEDTVIKSCAWCGEDIKIPPARQGEMGDYDLRNAFCDKECESAWKSANWVEEQHPSWEGGNIETECAECGHEVRVKPAKYEQQDRFFCSRECLGSWQSSETVVQQCPNCGSEVERKPYEFKGERGFCDSDCFSEWLSKQRKGEENPQWAGGKPEYYGEDWQEIRRRAVERDDEECQCCGISRDAHIKRFGRDLEVHHIIPIRTFDEPNEANTMDNVVTLCQKCHMEHEGLSKDELPFV
jgi:5-methylcytosine-specific restriction endonuclease McrA